MVVVLAVVVVSAAGAATPSPARAQAAGFRTERGVVYETVDGQQLAMDVFTPDGSGPFPAVELIHGGGFVAGDRRLMDGLGRWLAGNGFVAFSIDYRLAPEFPFPAAPQDAEAAVEYVREHASDMLVDPSRIAAFGGSAGATLAASVATSGSGPFDRGARVAAFVGWSGVYDFVGFQTLPTGTFAAVLGDAYLFGKASPDPSLADARAQAASPASHVSCDTPPGFVANSRHDLIPLPEAQNMDARLQKAGVPHELFVATTGHSLQYSAEAKGPTLDFLTKYLKDEPRRSGCGTAPPPSPSASPSASPAPTPSRPSRTPRAIPPPRAASGGRPLVAIALGGVIALVVIVLLVALPRRRARSGGPAPPR